MLPTEGNLIARIVACALLGLSVILFAWAFLSRLRLVFLGRWENRFDDLRTRFRDFFSFVFAQTRVVREPFAGFVHFFIFWGFIAVAVNNLVFMVAPAWPAFYIPFVSGTAWYALVFDVFVVVVLVAVLLATFRRVVLRPPGPTSGFGAYLILFLIGGLMFTDLVNEGWLISSGAETELARWMPAGLVAASVYDVLGLGGTAAGFYVYVASWWAHLLMLLGFLVYIPISKHMHLLVCPGNEFFHQLDSPGRVADCEIDDESLEHFGVTRMDEFNWKDLLDLLACVECGRCQDNCPAFNTDKPLSPKEVIVGLRHVLFDDGRRIKKLKGRYDEENIESLVDRDEGLSYDSIWACTNCGACVEHCPISIEHVDKIIGIRRSMVLNEGRLPQEVGPTITGVVRRNNPWNLSEKDRLNWAKGLEVPTVADKPNAEYLYWVGCISSFDERSTKVARAFATLMNKAGFDYAVLGTEEGCCAESFRRIGAEDLFKEKNAANIEKFKEYGVKKVVTTCPHCYNTFKNEYPGLGFEFDEVVHHTDLLAGFIADGRLKPEKRVDMAVTFHDSCFLGRFNDIYETPRDIIRAIPGATLQEMEKNYSKSFCCGAGGGRMWMEEDIGERINLDRARQALATEPDCIAAGCAYCMNMFDDALKEEGVEEAVKFMDVAELLAESVE
jgi:Fe-S oxidoreductase